MDKPYQKEMQEFFGCNQAPYDFARRWYDEGRISYETYTIYNYLWANLVVRFSNVASAYCLSKDSDRDMLLNLYNDYHKKAVSNKDSDETYQAFELMVIFIEHKIKEKEMEIREAD